MEKEKNQNSPIFDQRNQIVNHQVNIVGGEGSQHNIVGNGGGLSQNNIFSNVIDYILSSELPSDKKARLIEVIRDTETEILKGDSANPQKLNNWFSIIAEQIPPVAEMLLRVILLQSAGVTDTIKTLAKSILSSR